MRNVLGVRPLTKSKSVVRTPFHLKRGCSLIPATAATNISVMTA